MSFPVFFAGEITSARRIFRSGFVGEMIPPHFLCWLPQSQRRCIFFVEEIPPHFRCWDFPVNGYGWRLSRLTWSSQQNRWLGADVHPLNLMPPSHSQGSPQLWFEVDQTQSQLKMLPEFSYIFIMFRRFSWGDRCHLHAIGVHLFLQPAGLAILRSSGLTGERCHRLCPPGTGRHHRGGSEGGIQWECDVQWDGFYMGNPSWQLF